MLLVTFTEYNRCRLHHEMLTYERIPHNADLYLINKTFMPTFLEEISDLLRIGG